MATASFATVGDYRRAFDTDVDNDRLKEMLDRASRKVASALRKSGIAYDNPDDDFAADLMDVVCDMVHRAQPDDASTVPFGVSQYNMSANGFSEGWSVKNPFGDLYLTREEKARLGVVRSRIGYAQMGRA